MTDKGKVLELIQKLLALANDKGASEFEAANALKRANDLMVKHNIEVFELEAAGAVKPDVTSEEFSVHRDKLWRHTLITSIAANNFCTTVRLMGRSKIEIIGRPENIAVVRELSTWIMGQLEQMAPKAAQAWINEGNELRSNYGGERRDKGKRKFMSGWLQGAVARVHQRLDEYRRTQEAANVQVTAIVISHNAENDAFKQDKYEKLTKGHSRSNVSHVGYMRGARDGANVSITPGSRQVGGSRGQLKGG